MYIYIYVYIYICIYIYVYIYDIDMLCRSICSMYWMCKYVICIHININIYIYNTRILYRIENSHRRVGFMLEKKDMDCEPSVVAGGHLWRGDDWLNSLTVADAHPSA